MNNPNAILFDFIIEVDTVFVSDVKGGRQLVSDVKTPRQLVSDVKTPKQLVSDVKTPRKLVSDVKLLVCSIVKIHFDFKIHRLVLEHLELQEK